MLPWEPLAKRQKTALAEIQKSLDALISTMPVLSVPEKETHKSGEPKNRAEAKPRPRVGDRVKEDRDRDRDGVKR